MKKLGVIAVLLVATNVVIAETKDDKVSESPLMLALNQVITTQPVVSPSTKGFEMNEKSLLDKVNAKLEQELEQQLSKTLSNNLNVLGQE